MHLQFLVLLICASAQLCASSKSFTVENCSACATIDESRDNITMAMCAHQNATGAATCTCIDFPYGAVTPSIVYYPVKEGNVMRCKNTWSTGYAFLWSLNVIVWLYTGAHSFYVVALSGLCSKHCRCTKHNASALFGGIHALCFLIAHVLTIATRQYDIMLETRTGVAGLYQGITMTVSMLYWVAVLGWAVCFFLLATSISDMVNHGEDMAGRRRCLNIVFWILMILMVIASAVFLFGSMAAPNLRDLFNLSSTCTVYLLLLGPVVFVIIAHRRMNQIVREHSEKKIKPPIVLKLDDLSAAICRYYYAYLILYSLAMAYLFGTNVFEPFMNSKTYWIQESFVGVFLGISYAFLVCLLEGKPVPTFPMGLCRRGQQSPALHFTGALGDALALLTKYGLDTQRKEEFPVEVEKESLLSTSPLIVAAAPDKDLLGSIDYLLDRCVGDNGEIAKRFLEMPVGRLLRPGCSQHVVTPRDIPHLHDIAERCLKWAKDPRRKSIKSIAGMTDDEAAAIQLYTQHCCVYPLLNAALRDHAHPENLQPFLPYMKLLLTALNKLPLVRMKVYRGMNGDVHETYNQLQDQVFRWWAFSSTTPNESQAKVFMTDDHKTMFTIDAIGVDIAAFSAFPSEKELLLLPGTALVVKPGVEVAENYWRFEMSIWEAVQQQRQHADVNAEADTSESFVPRYQDTDLPHPGWEAIVSQEIIDVKPPTPRPENHECNRK